jgi:hypothetical protein
MRRAASSLTSRDDERAQTMVAIFPSERVVTHHARRAEPRSRSRQYDSFLLRLWHDDEADGMLRVELEHVQAGLSVEAVQVPLEWIVPEILGCLQSPRSMQAAPLHDPEPESAEVI